MSIKKPERIVGYLSVENDVWPFEFNEEEFILSLYPPTKEKWTEVSNPVRILREFDKECKSKEWIKTLQLKGFTSERYNIVFSVIDSKSNYQGFICYQVEWYYYCLESSSIDAINGFILTGQVIDSCFPPQRALKKNLSYSDNHQIEKMNVTFGDERIIYPCGSYTVTNGIKVVIEAGTMAKMNYNTTIPLEAYSYMRFDFLTVAGFDDFLTTVQHTISFFKYITYRNNVSFNKIETYSFDNARKVYSGALVFPVVKPETNMQKKE